MIIVRVIALVLVFAATALDASPFRGTVCDESGASTAKATVVIHWDSAGSGYVKTNVGIKQDVILTTDDHGSFSADLPLGFYDIFVAAPASSPACRKIIIKSDQASESTFRLSVDRKVSKEIGGSLIIPSRKH